MPIRTHRGRAAVYRRLWGWPLRSPKHLVLALVLAALLITAIGIVMPKIIGGNDSASGQNGRSPQAGSVPTQSTVDSNGRPLPTRLTTPLIAPTSAPPAPEALTVAKAWANAWVNHPDGTTNEAWRETLKQYTTEEYLPQLSTVEVSNIPATKVTGEPVATESFTSSVTVNVPTDGPELSITVVRTNTGWLVSGYSQAS